MRRLTSIVAIVVAAVFAACFGDGPAPSNPVAATVVFAVPTGSNTCDQEYIGNIAIGSSAAFALTTHYSPTDGCNSGAMVLKDPYPIYRFAPGGGTAMSVGTLPYADWGRGIAPDPFVATSGGDLAFAFELQAGSSSEVHYANQIGSDGSNISQGAAMTLSPVGILTDGPNTYIGMTEDPAKSHSDHPEYPCCGLAQQGSGGSLGGRIISITNPSPPLATPNLLCSSATAKCMALNTTKLFFFQTGDKFAVGSIDKGGGAITPVGVQDPQHQNTAPVAIDANDAWVAWASSVAFATDTNSPPLTDLGCEISYVDVSGGGGTTRAFSTNNFTCTDLALDSDGAGAVWFTIVSLRSQYADQSGGNVSLKGNGVGRLDLRTGDLETVDFGLAGYNTGPRRVYIANGKLYAVDPKSIVLVDKAAIAGHHDFTP